MIKPEFYDDEKLAGVPRDARLRFIGMLNFSDDYGVVKGHPTWLKNRIFPYDEISPATFKKWLQGLEEIRAIIPFKHDGESFYLIRNFLKHQSINKPSKQRNPEPPNTILSIPPPLPEHSGSPTEPLPPEKKRREVKEKLKRKERERDFDRLWPAFPKKVGKQDALKAWEKLLKDGELPPTEVLLSAIEAQKKSPQWLKNQGEFIPYPATWLNGKRWEDEIEVGSAGISETQAHNQLTISEGLKNVS